MKNHFQPMSQQQFTRSRRQIYMSSIGRLMDKDVSCHIDRDQKRVVYQRKKQLNLIKLMNCLVIKIQRDCFGQLLRLSNFDRKDKKSDTIFLPQALLKNDSQVMKSYRQKLSTGQIDRYISLHIAKRNSSSEHVNISNSIINTQKISKLSQHQKTIRTTPYPKKQQQQISVNQSTFMYNNHHHHNSKSIQMIRIKQHRDKLSNRKILQFSVSPVIMANSVNNNNSSNISKRQSNSSNKNRRCDIIHITYKQFNLSNNGNSNGNNNNKLVNFNSKQKCTINKQQYPFIQQQQLQHVQRRVSTFDINEFCLQQENVDDLKKVNDQQEIQQCQSFFSTSENVLKQLKQNYSPSLQRTITTNYIGKNKFKNLQVISSIQQFDHIDIGC